MTLRFFLFFPVLPLVCTKMVGWKIPIINIELVYFQKGHVFFVCHVVV